MLYPSNRASSGVKSLLARGDAWERPAGKISPLFYCRVSSMVDSNRYHETEFFGVLFLLFFFFQPTNERAHTLGVYVYWVCVRGLCSGGAGISAGD